MSALLLAGCAGTHRKGISRFDQYDAVTVDQMVGNNVSRAVFEKTIVCLNARRETRRITAVTNVNIIAVTNHAVLAVTNQTISIATNYLVTTMTNATPPPALSGVTPPAGETAAVTETNVIVVATPGPSFATNVQVSVANNKSSTVAPNQTAANHQMVRTYNNQITTTSNNVSISVMTNQMVTAETNQVVSYQTNYAVSFVTNVVALATNSLVHDYFLYTEMTPPPEFALAQGESLVLLVDGVRYGFSPNPSGTAFVARRGFTSGLYRVPPEVLVAIANAKEVRIRFKGVNSVVERTMSTGSKKNFRAFLVKYFAPEPAPSAPKVKIASTEEPARTAAR